MRKFNDSLPLKLLRTRDKLMGYFRPLFLQYELTEQQWRVLRALYEYKELEPSQLAEYCNILTPSMTGILNRLEQAGHIYKRKGSEDRRRFVVGMTAPARDLFDDLSPEVEKCYDKMRADIDNDKVDELSELLDQVLERLDSLED
ncbi:homoprotocatechuate degradation operon regulator HpaR [Aliagarivorans taiwanensis]|uniref:homoprotocatechuate degradation operon regulator HpaR n=1 Tax=Aliagarivorans taiwanensis TaxID=561966 RepID=UPI00041FEAF5|nr:homoprotocatechuate degradation operon regulator HpaR [Aliagarivorans taiwanensis]